LPATLHSFYAEELENMGRSERCERETGMDQVAFPEACPWDTDQILDEGSTRVRKPPNREVLGLMKAGLVEPEEV
jgi:hypothetical protein